MIRVWKLKRNTRKKRWGELERREAAGIEKNQLKPAVYWQAARAPGSRGIILAHALSVIIAVYKHNLSCQDIRVLRKVYFKKKNEYLNGHVSLISTKKRKSPSDYNREDIMKVRISTFELVSYVIWTHFSTSPSFSFFFFCLQNWNNDTNGMTLFKRICTIKYVKSLLRIYRRGQ